jgi:hypothetical protein
MARRRISLQEAEDIMAFLAKSASKTVNEAKAMVGVEKQ